MILAVKTADHTTQLWLLRLDDTRVVARGVSSSPAGVGSDTGSGEETESVRRPDEESSEADRTRVEPDVNWESGRQLSDELLRRINVLLQSRGHQLKDLTGIIIFSGPGSFTSLRIGHTVVNALADSLGIPVTGATGDNWQAAALAALKTTKPGRPALPMYGSEANITRPKV